MLEIYTRKSAGWKTKPTLFAVLSNRHGERRDVSSSSNARVNARQRPSSGKGAANGKYGLDWIKCDQYSVNVGELGVVAGCAGLDENGE